MTDEVISRADARAKGLKRFFTGLPCDNGHISQSYTSTGKCVVCSNEAKASWAARNKERVKTYNAEWHSGHLEERRAYSKARYEANIDCERAAARDRGAKRWEENRVLILEQGRQYRARNVEKVRERNRVTARKFRLENPELAKSRPANWLKNNPHKIREYNLKRRCKILNAPGSHTKQDLQHILRLQKNRCAMCRKKFCAEAKPTLDHIIALSRGGSNSRSNLQFLCMSCNCRKSNIDPLDFSRSQGMLL